MRIKIHKPDYLGKWQIICGDVIHGEYDTIESAWGHLDKHTPEVPNA